MPIKLLEQRLCCWRKEVNILNTYWHIHIMVFVDIIFWTPTWSTNTGTPPPGNERNMPRLLSKNVPTGSWGCEVWQYKFNINAFIYTFLHILNEIVFNEMRFIIFKLILICHNIWFTETHPINLGIRMIVIEWLQCQNTLKIMFKLWSWSIILSWYGSGKSIP